jgi:hypothetical protein
METVCPACKESVNSAATKCPHCGSFTELGRQGEAKAWGVVGAGCMGFLALPFVALFLYWLIS